MKVNKLLLVTLVGLSVGFGIIMMKRSNSCELLLSSFENASDGVRNGQISLVVGKISNLRYLYGQDETSGLVYKQAEDFNSKLPDDKVLLRPAVISSMSNDFKSSLGRLNLDGSWSLDLLPKTVWESYVKALHGVYTLSNLNCSQVNRFELANVANLVGVAGNILFPSGATRIEHFYDPTLETIVSIETYDVSRSNSNHNHVYYGTLRSLKGDKLRVLNMESYDKKVIYASMVETSLSN